MSKYDLVVSGFALLALFVYGLQSLSREIEEAGGTKLKAMFSRVTEPPVLGDLLGILVTALIQSSGATWSAGAITLRGSLRCRSFAVLLGANVGTTAYGQKIGPRSNSLFGARISLFGRNNSLFRQKNSLFHCVGNLAVSR